MGARDLQLDHQARADALLASVLAEFARPPASVTVSQWADAHKVGSFLRWYHMDHVELTNDFFFAAIAQSFHERGLMPGSVESYQVFAKVQTYMVFLHVFHEGGHIVGHAKEHSTGIAEVDLDVFENALAPPVVG